MQCVSALLPRARRETGKATLLVYVVVMFSLGTIAVFMHLHWVQEFLIDNRNYPGGPLVYDATFYSNSINITGVVWCADPLQEPACRSCSYPRSYFIMNWMADGLLVSARTLHSYIGDRNLCTSVVPPLRHLRSTVYLRCISSLDVLDILLCVR